MATTIRQQIFTAVKTRLEAILTSGGYNFDLGSNVFEWRDPALENSDLPALIIKDISEVIESDESIDYHVHNLTVDIGIFAQEGVTTSIDIRQMIGDVNTAIKVDETWGDLAIRTEAQGDETKIEQNKNIIGLNSMQITIVYATPTWDAYTAL